MSTWVFSDIHGNRKLFNGKIDISNINNHKG